MSSFAPESGAERLEEGKEGRGRSSAPAGLFGALTSLSPPQLRHSTLQTGAEQGRSGQALLSPAPASRCRHGPSGPRRLPGDPPEPPKTSRSQASLQTHPTACPSSCCRCLTPSCPENPKSSFPARWVRLNQQPPELYMVGSCMSMVLMDAQLCGTPHCRPRGKVIISEQN